MIELGSGQTLALTHDDGAAWTRLTLGLGWDRARTAGYLGTGAPEIDLDMSAIQFAGGKLFDLAFFNQLSTRDGSVVHEGDNLSGRGDGDDEVLTVDLDRVHAPVHSIFVLVSSFQGHALEWINRAYCRVLDDHDEEVARMTLTRGVPEPGLVLGVLERAAGSWTLRVVGEGIPARDPVAAVDHLAPFLGEGPR